MFYQFWEPSYVYMYLLTSVVIMYFHGFIYVNISTMSILIKIFCVFDKKFPKSITQKFLFVFLYPSPFLSGSQNNFHSQLKMKNIPNRKKKLRDDFFARSNFFFLWLCVEFELIKIYEIMFHKILYKKNTWIQSLLNNFIEFYLNSWKFL